MGKRATKPTALKLIEGEKNKNRVPANEVKPRPIAPGLPKGLDPKAKKAWRRLGPVLERLGLLTEADGDNFAALCANISRLELIRAQIKKLKKDITIETKQGPKVHPLLVEERARMQTLRQQAQEFGLTPRGRAGLVVGTGQGKDDMDDLLNE